MGSLKMKITISALSDLTGFDRRTISRRLADLKCEDKGKGGKFYQSDHALSTLYGGGGENLDPAQERALLDNARRRLTELEFSKRRGDCSPLTWPIAPSSNARLHSRADSKALRANTPPSSQARRMPRRWRGFWTGKSGMRRINN
jgi:hypothetical protein